jgi:hypothetical protein
MLNKLDSLIGDLPEVEEPGWVAEKMAERICLGCNIKVPEGEDYFRGLHGACYHMTLRRIRDGDWTESERIAIGKLSKDRRKPGKIAAIDLAAQKSISEAASDDVEKKLRRLSETKKTHKK